MTIRKKLVFWLAGLLAVIIVAFSFITYSLMSWSWLDSIDQTLNATADQIILNSQAVVVREFGGGQDINVRLAELDVFRASGVHVQVWQTSDGEQSIPPRFVAASANVADFNRPLDAEALGSLTPVYHDITVDGTPLRVLTRPITLVSGEIFGNVQVAASLEAIKHNTRMMLIVMVVSCAAAILGAVAIGMGLANQVFQPVDDIIRTAEKIARAEDLNTRIPWNGPNDELGRLTSVFNHMLARLEQVFRVQQRFVADVSHELRTPLTAMRGNLDLMKRYGADQESLEAIESEVERMSRMVSDLLTLARADSGGLQIDLYPLDVDTVVSDVYRDAKVLSSEREIKVSIERFEPVRVNGNADRLKQLLLNLITNALKFTPHGGQVTMSLYRHHNHAIIEVSDTGIGIKPEDVEHIFERFYQADTARVHMGGAGLGLSIAKWIAEVHGGKIEVVSEVSSGTTFTVWLPTADQETHSTTAYSAPTRPRLGLIRRSRETHTSEGQQRADDSAEHLTHER